MGKLISDKTKQKALKKATEVIVPRVASVVPPRNDRAEARAKRIRSAVGLKF